MQKIILVGTVHNMLPKHKDELRELLEGQSPDQLLLEIEQSDIKDNKLQNYPKEMIFAYKWAKAKNIKVNGFDSKIEVIKDSITPQKLKKNGAQSHKET